MADDEILDIVAGISQGFLKGYMPFAQEKHKNKLLMQRQEVADVSADKRAEDSRAYASDVAETKYDRENFIESENIPGALKTNLGIEGNDPVDKTVFGALVKNQKTTASSGRYVFNTKTGKFTLDGKPVKGSSVPTDAKVERLTTNIDPSQKTNMERAGITVVRDGNRAIQKIGESSFFAKPKFPGAKVVTSSARIASSKIPGTDEYDIQQLIESIKSNVGIDALLNIKREGSGLGQVPQKQLETLQSLLGNLKIGRDTDLLVSDIQDIVDSYQSIVDSEAGKRTGRDQGGSDINEQALVWAKSNPNDPRSKAIIDKVSASRR